MAKEIARGRRIVHLAVHRFTPELEGELRNADTGLLYDGRRKAEAKLCRDRAAIPDTLTTVPKAALKPRLTALSTERVAAVDRALRFALGLL